ncbi:MAG: DMT family transporter [Chloroflexi bacterium OHK40]
MSTGRTSQVMGPTEWGLLLLLSLLWGGSFFFSKVALAELPPFSVVLARVGIAAAALNAAILLSDQRMPADRHLWGRFAVMGLINNLIPFSLIFYGQTQIPSGLAAILNATTPLWTVLLAHWLTRDERLTPNRLAGVLIGFVGVIILLGPELLGGLGVQALAQLAVVGAAVSYAFAGIFGKGFRGIPPLVTATGQVTATAAMMLPIALLVDRTWALPAPTLVTWGALLGLALLSTALAYGIYFRLLATAGATNLLLVTFLIPVSALLLGTLILDERLAPGDFVGMAAIGLGLTAIDGRLLRRLRLGSVMHCER